MRKPNYPQKGDERPGMKPSKPGMITTPAIRPWKPAKPGMPGEVTTMPIGRPKVFDPSKGLSEEAKKAALEMIRKRKG
jgi:hypothetical protein